VRGRPDGNLLTLRPLPRKYLLLITVAGAVVLLDQVTKALVLHHLPLHHSVPVVPGFFDLTHVHNPGGAFGFLAGQDAVLRRSVFLLASSAAVGLILYFYHRLPEGQRWLGAALTLILGGALGNLIDRLRFGKVVDFLDVYLGRYHWPAFNVADSAITVGIGIFLVLMMMGRLPDDEK